MTGTGPLEVLKLAIYYASYLYFITAPLAFWLVVRCRGAARYVWAGFAIVITLLAYARFVEPRILLTAEHEVTLNGCFERAGSFRVAVFSDTHNGLFASSMPIDRIARRVNRAHADFVLVAGDFIYFLHPDRFDEVYAAFAKIKAPVFGVLGNHDYGLPGPDLSTPLNAALSRLGVRLIDNQPLKLSNSQFAIELTGLSDLWDERQDLSLLARPASAPRLVLTHNPATVREFYGDMRADLLIGGHTHGGQIYLPFVTCWLTSMCGAKRYGLSIAQDSYFRYEGEKERRDMTPDQRAIRDIQIFTTSGAGMVGLPMRFRVPPRIDVLNVRYKECV